MKASTLCRSMFICISTAQPNTVPQLMLNCYVLTTSHQMHDIHYYLMVVAIFVYDELMTTMLIWKSLISLFLGFSCVNVFDMRKLVQEVVNSYVLFSHF